MRNYIQDGKHITVEAASSVSSGEGYLVGKLFGVATNDAGTGDDLVIVTEGVFDLAKVSAQAWAVGNLIYWDDGNTRCTTVDTNVPIGVAVAVAANPTATGRVKLFGGVFGTELS